MHDQGVGNVDEAHDAKQQAQNVQEPCGSGVLAERSHVSPGVNECIQRYERMQSAVRFINFGLGRACSRCEKTTNDPVAITDGYLRYLSLGNLMHSDLMHN